MKFSLSLITDTLFSMFISFLLFFITVNYFMPRPYSIISSISLSAIFAVFVFRHLVNKKQKLSGKKLDRKLYDDAVIQLNLMTKAELLTYFENTLSKIGYTVEKKHGGLFIKEHDTYLFFKFGFEIVNKADIVKVFNSKEKTAKGYLLSESFSDEVKSFALRFDNLYTVNANELFTFLKENACLPENKYQLNQPTFDGLKAIKSLLDRKKAKTFALFGTTFLFMSYFVALKYYYIISGTLFLILYLTCLLFGENKTRA
ncbi:MAG: hypothetical protein IJX16_05340 [Clostridia bacterium]|nr:hypothetical protein [Clostridia bacterium]